MIALYNAYNNIPTPTKEAAPLATFLPIFPLLQYPLLPTGCEATAATSLLYFHGICTSPAELALSLPCSEITDRRAAHPADAFIGCPFRKKDSYGCYSPVIQRLLQRALKAANSSKQAYDLTGCPFSVLTRLLSHGFPSVVWVSMDLSPLRPSDSWETPHGSFTWLSNEHCVLLCGFQENLLFCCDPTRGWTACPYDTFLRRWHSLGRQAVTVL